MFKFEYDIDLNNDGRPYVNPQGETLKELAFVEHKFMAMEIARYVIGSTINTHFNNPIKFPLPDGELPRLQDLEAELTRISDIYAGTIKEQFELLGIADRLINQKFDLTVLNIAERDALNYNGIIFADRVYKRQEGLKVKLIQTGQIFELIGGIDNIHWIDIT